MPIRSYSLLSFWLCAALLVACAFLYYPKWEKGQTEATLSWDVSGYYLYLPAVFIYHDVRELSFGDTLLQKYRPAPAWGAFRHPGSGHYVMKYSCGQALQFLPWFTLAHLLAEPLGYPADGFSLPYQAAISWGSLLTALLGLWFARRNLLYYFSDRATAVALLCMVWGTNYLNYSAIDGAMTHNWLFTAYCLLIFSTIQFYKKPSYARAAALGILLGWMALTRPTEIVAALLPLLWGIDSLKGLRERLQLLRRHAGKVALAALCTAAMGSLQLIYWKYAAGEWLVYSYEDQGFSWRNPHFHGVLLSYRAGWLTYSPMMFFAVAGLFFLPRRQRNISLAIGLFCLVFVYITAAWDIWWYGGSLGMRAMVQSYAVWLFPLACFAEWVIGLRWARWIFAPLAGALIGYSLWWVYQAHHANGCFVSEQMTKQFFWKVLGHSEPQRDWYKLLDNKDYFDGAERRDVQVAYYNSFDQDSTATSAEAPVNGARSLLLTKEQQHAPEYFFELPAGATQGWMRAIATIRCDNKEWDWWRMTQFVIRFYDGEQKIKENMIRIQRLTDGNETREVWLDVRIPERKYTRASILFWNAGSDKTIRIDDLKAEIFK